MPRPAAFPFRNRGWQDVWIKANDADYAAFDSKKKIPPGGSWTFTFTQAGAWDYTNT